LAGVSRVSCPYQHLKIANTLIRLKTGVLQDENTLMKWDGINRNVAAWNKDNTLQSTFRASCVPRYRELAQKIRLDRMRTFVDRARYGRMNIHTDNLGGFWLTGKSRISQMEEIDFLRRVYSGNMPFSERNRAILKKIMLITDTPVYKLYDRAGWADATTDSPNIGWFVGYVEKGDDMYFFATNVEHPRPISDTFIPDRRRITGQILAELGVM